MTLPVQTAEKCIICSASISVKRREELAGSEAAFATCTPRCSKRRQRRSQRRRGLGKHFPRERVKPVLGPRAKGAMRALRCTHPKTDEKRRKLLVLIAAYADAGEQSPAVRTFALKLRISINSVDQLLGALERDGFVEIERRKHERNRYQLKVGS